VPCLWGVVIGALGLGLLDVFRADQRVPEAPSAWVLLAAWAVASGTSLLLGGAFFGLRGSLARRLPERRRWLLGLCDGLAFGFCGLVLEDMATVGLPTRVALCLGLGLGAALLSLLPRFPAALWLLASVLALLAAEWLPPREKSCSRLALDMLALGSFAVAFRGWRERSPAAAPDAPSAGVWVFLILLVSAPLALLRSNAVRGFVYEYGAHTRAFLPERLDPHALVSAWLGHAGAESKRRPLGTVHCRDLQPGERHRLEPFVPSALSAGAAGADVLLLSFDALRWDHADAIPRVWQELEPAVHFSRAVAPAPRTMNAFAALLRGVPARALSENLKRTIGDGLAPTLAEVLVRRGYRAVQVPTHRYFGRGKAINTGFELVVTPDFKATREKQGKAYPIVRAETALATALDVARQTEQPLLLWVHLMEGHEPYRWTGGQGPATPAGQRHAFADLDPLAADFLREYRAARSSRPLVIAVFGDHGEEFGEHGGKFHSTSVYGEQVRAALALHAPGLVSQWIEAPVAHASLPATVLDLLGMAPVASFSEPTLLPCLHDSERCPDLAVSQLIALGRAIGYTFDRYRLVVDPKRDTLRLFDTDSDPLERRDLAAREPGLVDALSERARRFDAEHCLPDPARE
jgi:hypothetical protein